MILIKKKKSNNINNCIIFIINKYNLNMENKNTIYLIQTIGYNEIFYFYVDKTELILHLNKLIHFT